MAIPFTPEQALAARKDSLPNFVVDVVNKLLGRRYDGGRITITQDEVIEAMILEKPELNRDTILKEGYLNFEPAFRQCGWRVTYDRPAYNENYAANFTFEKKRDY